MEATAAYQGHVERDLSRIRLEQHLREVILTFLETARVLPKAELYKQIRDHVRFRCKTDPMLAGFDVDAARRRAASGQSMGLLGMEERVTLAGGRLVVESRVGHGTEVRVRLPLGDARRPSD